MYRLELIRLNKDSTNPTIGKLYVYRGNEEICEVDTLELPWKHNQRNVSCIPAGKYWVRKRWSKKYGMHFHITDVPDRSWILIHVANFVTQLRGCIAVGLRHVDINNDNVIDVANSRAALKLLLLKVDTDERVQLEIKNHEK